MPNSNTGVRAKRRIATEESCLHDLSYELTRMFHAFNEAVLNFNVEVLLTPPQARARAYEASLLNSKMIQSIQGNFPVNWKFGKYKRFMLSINGYIIFFKKLDTKNMPMNIVTNSVTAINNQQQLLLFQEMDSVVNPILYFGYRKDKYGNIADPKLVYIDENKLQWTITENQLNTVKVINIPVDDNNALKQATVKIRAEKVVKRSQDNT